MRGGPLPDEALARRLVLHEARVQQGLGRELRDLVDAWLLHDPADAEPFWNRVVAPRWPRPAGSFDRRLDETITLFATLDRLPHVRPLPLGTEPPDLAARLVAAGFQTIGIDRRMVLNRAEPALALASAPLPPGDLAIVRSGSAATLEEVARDVSTVLAESFSVDPYRMAALEADAVACAARLGCQIVLLYAGGAPVSAARRVTIDGGTYLSSIGTRPSWRGRGHGALVTALAIADAIADGSELIHLAVEVDNAVGIRLYHRLGFRFVGEPVPDLLLYR